MTNTGREVQKSQYQRVAVEHRDANGNLSLPKELIKGTYLHRYGEVPQDTQIKIFVLAGYKPNALLWQRRCLLM